MPLPPGFVFPDRISGVPGHPSFIPQAILISVFLDGKLVPQAATADAVEGWVERYAMENGRLVLDEEHRPKIIRDAGAVTFREMIL